MKALIWRGRVIDSYLAEVRIEGHVKYQAVMQDGLYVQTGVALESLVVEKRIKTGSR